jgi:hypothetical protein
MARFEYSLHGYITEGSAVGPLGGGGVMPDIYFEKNINARLYIYIYILVGTLLALNMNLALICNLTHSLVVIICSSCLNL